MKKKMNSILLIIITATLLVISGINQIHNFNSTSISQNTNATSDLPVKIKLSSNLQSFNPISIQNDADFFQQAYDNGWLGSGYDYDPYIIKDYLIDNNSQIGIHISSVSSYFIIQNVVVNRSLGTGIFISNSFNGKIQDCVVANITEESGTRNGITIEYSDFMTVQNTTLFNNTIGINVTESPDMNIINNTLYVSSIVGINHKFIYAFSTNDNIIGNNVSFSGKGFYFEYTQNYNNLIANNRAFNCSTGFDLLNELNVIHNSAYNNSLSGFNITSADRTFFSNNTSLFNGLYGFYVDNTNDLEFYFNIASDNIFGGIYIQNSNGLNALDNEITNNGGVGISIQSWSSGNSIERNLLQGNKIGIFDSGIYNKIITNTISKNTQYGVFLLGSTYCYVALNNISYNKQTGLYINTGSFNNSIVTNYFINNTLDAQDDSNLANQWQGNYFSDYTNQTYYVIPGTTIAIDNLPRAFDSDSDGMPNYFEKLYGFNPLVNDSSLDPDNDGLTNYQEFLLGTNPLVAQNFTTSTQTTTVTTTDTTTETTTSTNIPIVITTIVSTIISTTLDNTITTTLVNTTHTTIITFQFSTGSQTNQINTKSSVPGFQLLSIGLTLIVLLYIKKMRQKKD